MITVRWCRHSEVATPSMGKVMGDLNAAAARVRELAREFVAIKERFSEEEQFYLDKLLGNLICGDAEPMVPGSKVTRQH